MFDAPKESNIHYIHANYSQAEIDGRDQTQSELSDASLKQDSAPQTQILIPIKESRIFTFQNDASDGEASSPNQSQLCKKLENSKEDCQTNRSLSKSGSEEDDPLNRGILLNEDPDEEPLLSSGKNILDSAEKFLPNSDDYNIKQLPNLDSPQKNGNFLTPRISKPSHSSQSNLGHSGIELNNSTRFFETSGVHSSSSFHRYASNLNESMLFSDEINPLNESMMTIPREDLDQLRVYNYFWTPRFMRTGVSSFPFD